MIFSPNPNIFVSGLFFCTYVFLTGVLILNMLIGVLCDLVAKVNNEQRSAQAIAYAKQVLLGKLKNADLNGDGLIARGELLRIIHESPVALKRMDINELFLLQMEEMLYDNPDEETQIPIK